MASQNSPAISLEEIFKAEISLHKSDFEFGSPLDLGDFSIAFHSSDCPRCAYLTLKQIINGPAYAAALQRLEHGK